MSSHTPFAAAALWSRRVRLPAVLLALQAAALPVLAQQGAAPGAPAVAASAAPRSAGKAAAVRHTPDAPTQRTMERLRELLGPLRPAIEQQKLTGADCRALAGKVEGLLNELAQSAGQPPSAPRKAFVATVERDLRWAIETMRQSPRVEAQRTGALAMVQSLRNYGSYFDHPGWAWP